MEKKVKKEKEINNIEKERKNYSLSSSTLNKIDDIIEHLGIDNRSNIIALCVSYYYDREINKKKYD